MNGSRLLPDHVRDKVRDTPESSYGANRVVVVIDDGTQIPDVFAAWGKEIVRVGQSSEVPFDISRIVNIVPQPK